LENEKSNRQVVITGMGVVSPLGCGVNLFWEKLLAGQSGVKLITEFDLSRCKTKIGASAAGFYPDEHFSDKDQKRISRAAQMSLVAAQEAVIDSGIDLQKGDSTRKAVILGSSITGFTSAEPFFEQYYDGWQGNPYIIPKVMNNAPASNLSIKFGFRGPLLTTDAACASSAHAIGYGLQLIRNGSVDVAIVGGADSALSPAVMQAWSMLRVLSSRNDTPEQACRPFSKDRDGIVLGEGAGILVLESEALARQRGARIYAEVSGYGATSDGHHITQPTAQGPMDAIHFALRDACILPGEVQYISAHGTATLWNDRNETQAIKAVFGDHAYRIPIVGIKGAIGHSIAATGALECISTALAIKNQQIPPTVNCQVPDPECDLDHVPEGSRQHVIENAISSSFAFGGSNAVLTLSRFNE